MKFDQDMLDEFLVVIRCDVEYDMADFKKLMVDPCVTELNISPTNLFNDLNSISFQASPTDVGFLILETDEQKINFEVKYDNTKITNIKIKEIINGEK